MPQLDVIRKRVPSADTCVGRVIAFHNNKHYDLGAYVGEGQVVLSDEGKKLFEALDEAAKVAKKPLKVPDSKAESKEDGLDKVEL